MKPQHCVGLGIIYLTIAISTGSASPLTSKPNITVSVCDILNSHCHCTSITDKPNINCRFTAAPHKQCPTLLQAKHSPDQLSRHHAIGKLDVSESDLSCLSDQFLAGLSRIDAIIAKSCQLKQVPEALLRVQHVRELDLSHNNMTTFTLDTLTKLAVRKLHLQSNNMETLTLTGQPPPKLSGLYISDNKLSQLPMVLWEMLREANITNNQFTSLPALPSPSLLRTLDASDNRLPQFPTDFLVTTPSLNELHLARNIIHMPSTTLPADMDLTRLKHLDLSGNAIHNMTPGLLANFVSLLTLDLSHNNMTSLQHDHDVFPQHTSRLQALNLSHNALMHLHTDTFLHLQHLRHLDLSHNPGLGRVGVSHVKFPEHLMQLDLSDCMLKRLDYCQLSRLHDLTFLHLANNPLHCSCDLHMLYIWYRNIKQASRETAGNWSCLPDDGGTTTTSVSQQLCLEDIQCLSADPVQAAPDISVTVNVILAEHNLITSWTVSDIPSEIQGFRVLYTQSAVEEWEGVDSASHVSPILGVALRSYTMTNIESERSYTVCVDVLANETSVVKRVCKTVMGNLPNIVVGILAGITFLIPCIIFVIYIFYKDRAMRPVEISYTVVAGSPQVKGDNEDIRQSGSALPVHASVHSDTRVFTTATASSSNSLHTDLDTQTNSRYDTTTSTTVADLSFQNSDPLDTHYYNKSRQQTATDVSDKDIVGYAVPTPSASQDRGDVMSNTAGPAGLLPPPKADGGQGNIDPVSESDQLVVELQSLMDHEDQ